MTEPQQLSYAEVIGLLDSWVGRAVALRVVSNDNDLIAVWHGVLGERTAAKSPASFWPLTAPDCGPARHGESPGVYLHRERLRQARLHIDPTVLDIDHGATRLSLRLL